MLSWWRRRTLRARLLIIGLVGLCVGLTGGGVALVAALNYVLQRSVENEIRHTASDVAALVDAGALPQPVPVAGTDRVQVVDAQGRVLAASIQADRLVVMLHPDETARIRSGKALYISGARVGLPDPVIVVGRAAGPPDNPQTVIVARSVSDLVKGVHLLRVALLIGFPVLVGLLALVAWRVIGATLRPVETLRRGAEEITGTGRAGALPVPAGNDEIHLLAVTLNGMLDRLEAGRIRQREFVADAAHELRSPLTNMRAQLEVAQHLGPAADWPAVGEDLLTDTQRLSRLVDDLLLLARSDDSTVLTRPEPVDVVGLLRDLGARHPSVRMDLPYTPLWTDGEPDALLRVFANLVDNALRHARRTVRISASQSREICLVAVTDDGPGIPAADRRRVFDRFTRLDDARARDAGGSGLGLAIVRELVRRHGGTVALTDAQPGPGLRVEVRLPRRVGPDPDTPSR
jgi:signal transduction histidine kinase